MTLINTGINKLNEILGGGIRRGIITDIFGRGGIGKTQLAMQICVNSLINNGKIFYQDTKGDFRPERMLELIKAKNESSSLLENVTVARATNIIEQVKLVEKITVINDISLLVIDDVTDLFSFEFSKESQSLRKHILFMKYMHNLVLTAIKKKIPIIVTNVVRSSNFAEKENLERSIGMFTHQKIYLSKVGSKNAAQVFSPFCPAERIFFVIRPDGIFDYS